MVAMAKFLCTCGAVVRVSGDIPNPFEWLLISDVKYDEFTGPVDAQELYGEMTHAFRCDACGRLWVYWNGLGEPPAEYSPGSGCLHMSLPRNSPALDEDALAARTAVVRGASLDEVARLLVEDRGLEPIPAVKALRSGAEVRLLTAKEAVHRNLPDRIRLEAEQLWDETATGREVPPGI